MNNSWTIDSCYLNDYINKNEVLLKIDPTSDTARHVVTEVTKDSSSTLNSEVNNELYSILVTEATFQPHEKGIFSLLGLKYNLELKSLRSKC